ncbi:MAG: ABC transporter permease subunit, partial [Verrucomicrobiae bacterium]|nr:ABC transporter permease subunit [Verrucomicrobiae bacterium]
MSDALPPNSGFRTTGRSRRGEPWVWLTAAGLAIGVIMALGLFLLILLKGTASFWPRPIDVMEVRDAEGATEKIAGFVTQESTRSEPDGTEHREIQVFRGNKDIRPEAFVFIDEANIANRSRPKDLMWVERMEYGPGIIEPVALETPEGRIEAADPSFHDKLDAVIERSEQAREEILDIERHQIGRISRELEKHERAERSGEKTAQELAGRRAELQASFEKLQAQSGAIHDKLKETKLVGRTVDGADVSYTSDVLVRTFMPNAAGFFDRLGEALSRAGAFLSEDPREANTEGGVFPAIFGTVVMTLAMSFFVTPFGVIAAIYLREYASQGLMVQFVRISVNNLAGVPSIVFGVFGLAFFVYTVGGTVDQWFFADKLPTPTYGTPGILWASLTLALLTLPVVIVATEEALAAVPRGVREAALACGASKWQT